MSSEDYSYTNDLDEVTVLSTVARRREQNHSPFAQVVAEMGDSHANYEYLDDNNSLSAGFDNNFEEVQAPLALEDFVGVDGSNLLSDLFESNSVFDIGTGEPGTQTPSGASQQSVSGTDFDTLPIAPIAKRPIEAPIPPRQPPTSGTAPANARRNNASCSNYGSPTSNVPNLMAALVCVTDGKDPATPFKYMDLYNISSPSALPNGASTHQQQQYYLNGSVKHGRENFDHALNSKHESGTGGSSIGFYGVVSRIAPRPPGVDTMSRGSKSSSSAIALPPSRHGGPPVLPSLQPSSLQNKSDVEGFGFGIETFLHGTQLGFGRQPSFKRIAPGATGLTYNASKPYYLIPDMSSENAAGGGATGAADTQSLGGASPSGPRGRAGGAGATDRNAEAFSNWLEALDPKANSTALSTRSGRGATTNNNIRNSSNNAGATNGVNKNGGAGPSIGEDFKREVDVMMKDLLGDYDLASGVTGAYALNNSVASGLPLPGMSTTNITNGGGTSNGRRGSPPPNDDGGGGGKDAMRQLEYDAFLKDVRMLTPTVRSPMAMAGVTGSRTAVSSASLAGGEKRRVFTKTTKTAIATVGPNPACAVEEDVRMPAVRPSQRGAVNAPAAVAPKSILNTASRVGSARAARDSATTTGATAAGAATPSKEEQQRLNASQDLQPPDASGALNRRRRVWSNPVPARSSSGGISGAALDPSTEAETAAEPPKPALRRVNEMSAGVHRAPPWPAPSPVMGPRPVTVNRAPRSAAAVVAAVSASKHSAPRKMPSAQQLLSPRAETKGKAPLGPSSTTYEDMDEDLLAGGYMTGASMVRSPESLFDPRMPSKQDHAEATVMMVPLSLPKGDGKDGGAAASSSTHGCRSSSMDSRTGATLLRQKWHPSWKKNGMGPSARTKSPEQVLNETEKATISSPSPTSVSAAVATTVQQLTARPLWSNKPLRKQSFLFDSAETTVATQRRTSVPKLIVNCTSPSTDSDPTSNSLPLPSFTPIRVSNAESMHGASSAAKANSPVQRDSTRKGTGVVTVSSVRRASRRPSTSPSTVEPIVLADLERPGFLCRVSARNADGGDDSGVGAAHNAGGMGAVNNSAQPRRRLTEFRGVSDTALPPSSSRSRISIGTTAEEVRAEAARQREREREMQQANEERRQRIQAFMAKRKAEKQMEELKRGQLVERDRRLEAFREEQERQRTYEATAPETVTARTTDQRPEQHQQQEGIVAGSGLNAIKASQRMRKSLLERPLRPSVPTASFIPDASTVPMSPPQQLHSEPSTYAAGPRRKRNTSPSSTTSVGSVKVRVRAVVVFINSSNNFGSNNDSEGGSGGAAKAEDKGGEHQFPSASSTASIPVYEGTSVAMELNEADHMLKVLQPQERARYYHVDEYVLIDDVNTYSSTKWSSDKGRAAGPYNMPNAPRNATGAPRRRLISLTLTEMSRKFLAGVNVALLLGSTGNAQEASVLAIREVVEGVASHIPAQSQLFASVAYVAGGNTEDLLTDPPRSVRSTFGTSPLFGPTLDGVDYVSVTGVGYLLRTITDVYKRVKVGQSQSEQGLLVISLLLKQYRDGDVVLSSYLITDAGCDGGVYTAILRKSQNAPFALFHSALGGPTLTTALMAVDSEDVTAVVPLLNVQHRLSAVMNKPCHVGSVRRFIELAQRELDTADCKTCTPATRPSNNNSSHTNNISRRDSGNSLSNMINSNSISNSKLTNAGRQQLGNSRPHLHKRLAEQMAMAKQILDDPQGYLPKNVPSTDGKRDLSTATRSSMPSTAPPSTATALITQLSKKQEDEVAVLHLTSVGQKRKVPHNVPATAAAAVTAACAAATVTCQTPVTTTTTKATTATNTTGNGTVLSNTAPGSTASTTNTNLSVCNRSAQKGLAGAARAPPTVSAVPLKHPSTVPTELPSPLPPARRSSNYIAAVTATSHDPERSASVRHSGSSLTDVPLDVSQMRTSRDGGGSGAVPLPIRRPVSDEQSVSVSAEYVRRGHGDDPARRNTGFMNLEDPGGSQSIPNVGKGTSGNLPQQQLQQQRLRNPSRASEHSELPPRPATTMTPTSEFSKVSTQESLGAAQRRGSTDGGRPSSGLQPFAPPMFQAGVPGSINNNNRKLLPGATTIGSNGPQWPSTPAFEIPTIPSVASIDTSFAHDVSISTRQSSNAYEGDKAPIPTSTKVRTLVVVDTRCRETSNVTYDNTMVIATTEDDFEEYDVDEVREATPGQMEPIQAELLRELCDTLLMGCNAAILGADSHPTGFSAQALKSVVHSIFAEMNRESARRSGHLSASIVNVKGESVVDLLKDGGDAQKLVIAISPLFGSCVHGVTYTDVSSGAAFNDIIDAALNRATAYDNGRDYGFLFCSLLFKLRLEDEGDVQVCSLVATFAGENVGLYTSVLDRSPLVPRALFHYALGGPSYTIALLGIGSEETRANQMLQVQKRLGEMSNRVTHPGSVAKFVAGIRNDLTPNLIAKYENSRDPSERAATKEMIERLAEMVKDAEALLVDFDHHQPKAYLHGDAEQRESGANNSNTGNSNDNGNKCHITSLPVLPASGATTAASSVPGDSKNGPGDDASVLSPQSTPAPARPAAAQRALPNITAVNPEAEGERIQSLVCFEQVMMGAGTVAVQGNSILCASQGGTRFDSDEVITCHENHHSLSSKLMDELVAKFLTGHHTALLAADSSYSAFTPLMLRHIANNILEAVLGGSAGGQEEDNGFAFTKPPTISGELQVSIALIKDDVTADLLPIDVDATYHRFEMEHTPLYGPRVVGVTPHLVANPLDFDHFLAVAIDNADPALQTADPGIMVVLLVLTQRVTKPVEDVLVSSLLCTAVFDAVHHYERVLEGNPNEPLDLFKNVLRGPCFSVALLGISDEEEDPGKLLRALNDLSQVRNRPPQLNSVSRHIRELQRGIVKLKERMTTSSNSDEKAYIQSRVEMAEKLLEEAESLQRNPLSLMQPRAFVPLGGTSELH